MQKKSKTKQNKSTLPDGKGIYMQSSTFTNIIAPPPAVHHAETQMHGEHDGAGGLVSEGKLSAGWWKGSAARRAQTSRQALPFQPGIQIMSLGTPLWFPEHEKLHPVMESCFFDDDRCRLRGDDL